MNSRRPMYAGTRLSTIRCALGAEHRDPTHHSAATTSLGTRSTCDTVGAVRRECGCAPGAAKAGLASLMRPLGPLPECRSCVCRYDVARAMPRRSLRRYWPGGVMSSPSSVCRAPCATRESRSACSGEGLCPSLFRALPRLGSYRFADTNTQRQCERLSVDQRCQPLPGCSVHDRLMCRAMRRAVAIKNADSPRSTTRFGQKC
jgi:hypothetical protein